MDRIQQLVAVLLEDAFDEIDELDPKDLVQRLNDVDVSLDEIKAVQPVFFNRSNTRFFGTKKVYKYGNFLVLKNVKNRRTYSGAPYTTTDYVIYEFRRTPDAPEGILLHRETARDLAAAKALIKGPRNTLRPS